MSYRTAAIAPDELPENVRQVPARTDSGEPWVKWVRIGEYSGWMSFGTREPKFREPSFWESTFMLCSDLENPRMDAAHAIGPGMLSIGALGLTALSGYAQALLHACFAAHPVRYMEVMLKTVHLTGAHVSASEKSPSGYAFNNGEDLFNQDLADLLVGCSDSITWKSYGKERSHLWVSACSRLLRDARFDKVQIGFLRETLPELLTETSRKLLRWPQAGVTDGWGWSDAQRCLWAVSLALALHDDTRANMLMEKSVKEEPWDAQASLEAMIENVTVGTFRERVLRTVERAREIFKV